ncbi:MAG: DEAD/DEAH box helicase [Owenweeksia sp.]|nr:DEAD/DEAH box helicase [Owenweeksia sp.]
MNEFQALGLSSPILEALQKMGFESPTEIQRDTIPDLLSEEVDFIGLAQTGTGKTAAFGIASSSELSAQSTWRPHIPKR